MGPPPPDPAEPDPSYSTSENADHFATGDGLAGGAQGRQDGARPARFVNGDDCDCGHAIAQ